MTSSPKRNGRPPYVPTQAARAKVVSMRLAGARLDDIACRLNISVKTLRLHFESELDNATADLIGSLAWVCYQKAAAGDGELLMFLLRTKGGFLERVGVQATQAPAGAALRHLRARLTR